MRLTVQFQSVLDSFTPHDTVFSFAAASELTDSSLGLSTMLQPSRASLNSSNSSLRRKRLNQISEDAEDTAVSGKEDKGKDEVREKNGGLRLNLSLPTPAEVDLPLTPNSITAFGRHELDELPASAVLAKALLAKRKEEAAAAAAALAGTPSSNVESSQEKNLHPPQRESFLASPKLSESP